MKKMIDDRIRTVKFDKDRLVFHLEKPVGTTNTLETWIVPPGASFEVSR
jgi:hypothetical protein